MLKTLCGLSVPEIARGFLSEEAAIRQRIVRAKRTLRDLGLEFELPAQHELRDRLDSVLQSLYLLFNEGYTAQSGTKLYRLDLCKDTIYLTEQLAAHTVGNCPKIHALLALMLFQASRLPARANVAGDMLLLSEQDRTLWDLDLVRRGHIHLELAAQGGELSSYHLEAGIAASSRSGGCVVVKVS